MEAWLDSLRFVQISEIREPVTDGAAVLGQRFSEGPMGQNGLDPPPKKANKLLNPDTWKHGPKPAIPWFNFDPYPYFPWDFCK